jgi:hypothetical protein
MPTYLPASSPIWREPMEARWIRLCGGPGDAPETLFHVVEAMYRRPGHTAETLFSVIEACTK